MGQNRGVSIKFAMTAVGHTRSCLSSASWSGVPQQPTQMPSKPISSFGTRGDFR